MIPKSSIATISTDLNHEETILQIADSLDQLETITTEIFRGFRSKIEEHLKHLDDIDSRIQIAGERVDALKQKKQRSATCLYSSAKFPAGEFRDYELCCTSDQLSSYERKSDPIIKKLKNSAESLDRGLNQKELREKLHFYHVKPKPKSANSLFESPPQKLPSRNLWSASSFLLFNTAENPFGISTFIDPLEVTAKRVKNLKNVSTPDEQSLQEAPSSLSADQIGLDTLLNENLYVPDLGDLPDFELPEVLPDLPGIAHVNEPQDLPDLPIFEEKTNSSTGAPPPPPVEAPPPLLPAPMVEAPPILPPVSVEAPPTVQLPPIPTREAPKPPVEVTMAAKIPPGQDLPDIGKPPAAMLDGGRASLMEAIRKAGGTGKAGLKSVKEQKAEEKKNKQATLAVKTGGDLMSDLANKLAMRRKGISGNQRPEASSSKPFVDGVDTMTKLSSLIPPPPSTGTKKSTGVNSSSDEDWN